MMGHGMMSGQSMMGGHGMLGGMGMGGGSASMCGRMTAHIEGRLAFLKAIALAIARQMPILVCRAQLLVDYE
jgi:hypothetical protein